MPSMILRVTNSIFESTSTGDYDTVDDAYRAAILSGLEIARSEIIAGADVSMVNLSVDLVGLKNAAHGVLAISTARILSPASN